VSAPRRVIGIDESGKGDFFGPLVVAGCLVEDSDHDLLRDLGVRDSKKIADKKLLTIDERLRSSFVHAVVVFEPSEYNRVYDRIRNLNILLANGHAQTIQAVLNQAPADLAISDKFGKEERLLTALSEVNCRLPVKQIVRGEALLPVAAASIMARAEFVRRMAGLSEKYGMTIPKGASAQVDAVGREIVRKHGLDELSRLAKLHFKNYARASKLDLF